MSTQLPPPKGSPESAHLRSMVRVLALTETPVTRYRPEERTLDLPFSEQVYPDEMKSSLTGAPQAPPELYFGGAVLRLLLVTAILRATSSFHNKGRPQLPEHRSLAQPPQALFPDLPCITHTLPSYLLSQFTDGSLNICIIHRFHIPDDGNHQTLMSKNLFSEVN